MSDNKDQAFREEFEVLSTGTDEYAFTIPTIRSTVIDQLPQRELYLDVGAGHGNLTRHFAPLFQRTVVVEPNPVLLNELLDWAKGQGVTMTGHNSVWDASVKLNETFDFAVMSHVLYYMPASARADFVGRAFQLLKPGGRLVIITVADRGSDIARLYQTFLPPNEYDEIPFADEVYRIVQEWGYDADFVPFHSDIGTRTEEEMNDVLNFLLLQRVDFTVPATASRRRDFIAQYLTKPNGYAIASPGGIVTLKRQA
jgi:SAM-dependent methyltransferase